MKHALTLQNWRGNGALWRASIKTLKIPRHNQTDHYSVLISYQGSFSESLTGLGASAS